MSYRVKNLFAVTSDVVALSVRSTRTPQDMAATVRERLAALTRAHELTRPGLIDTGGKAGRATTLHALIRTILAPYVDSDRSKEREDVVLDGPGVPTGGNAATGLALVLHEFATNAAKYGALSSPTGVVHIDCSVEQDELRLTWKEHGGPPLDGPPDGEGFGGLLTRRVVADQFGGRISSDWDPEGLIAHLSVPMEPLRA